MLFRWSSLNEDGRSVLGRRQNRGFGRSRAVSRLATPRPGAMYRRQPTLLPGSNPGPPSETAGVADLGVGFFVQPWIPAGGVDRATRKCCSLSWAPPTRCLSCSHDVLSFLADAVFVPEVTCAFRSWGYVSRLVVSVKLANTCGAFFPFHDDFPVKNSDTIVTTAPSPPARDG